MENEKQRPIHEVTLPFAGAILKASIWRHVQEGGKRPRYSVSFTRGYREKETGKWTFNSFVDRDALLGVSALAQACHSWILANDGEGDADDE